MDKELKWLREVCGDKKVYPIPRNGLILALMAGLHVVDSSDEADIIFDDLVDSGRTIQPYIDTTDKKIVVLYVKPHSPYKDLVTFMEERTGWIEFPWENTKKDSEDLVVRLLEHIGENPSREGLVDTPRRVLKSYKELYAGYSQDVEPLLTFFESDDYDQMVVLTDIEFYSTCEHHMLPFFGKAHVAYIPDGKVVGLSKLARVVDVYARRLQNQERLTKQIADALQTHLKPKGVAVVMEAQHFCMKARGVRKQNSTMKTACLTGRFKDDINTRQEFYKMI